MGGLVGVERLNRRRLVGSPRTEGRRDEAAADAAAKDANDDDDGEGEGDDDDHDEWGAWRGNSALARLARMVVAALLIIE